MDERRLREYVALIKELLNCPDGEEFVILKANTELVDEDLIMVMEQIAIKAEAQGATGTAEFLRNLAQELKVMLTQATKTFNSEDDERPSAYLKLIETLMSCPSGSEAEILRKNQDLVDTQFVLTLAQVAGIMAEIGEQKASQFLQGIATPLAEGMKGSLPALKPAQNYLDFLGEVLRTTSNSNGNAKVVYPLLAANLDKLNTHFAQVMKDWVKETVEKVQPSIAHNVVVDIVNFSVLIQQFSLGNKAENVEIAIIGYQVALAYFNREKYPDEWAGTQNNLGNALVERINGDNADNLDEGIKCYERALEVYQRDVFPEDWAMTQNNLGTAYKGRENGDKAENLEIAIQYYFAALDVYQRSVFPYQWAAIQYNLGNVYCDRVAGEKAENMEIAILSYNAALEVYQPNLVPQQWAMTQYNLGNTYKQRIRGDKNENLRKADECYLAAMNVYKRYRDPQE
ncbi:MAG: tetratricopeptide repeat protein [Rivularia sp. T60_A2020_040]|nr:tetratricopeptide repeat protein [Rivularia sp. T60_A2020_040]